jgi:hypothetical protein
MEQIQHEGAREIDRAAARRQVRRLVAIGQSLDGGLSIIETTNPDLAEQIREEHKQIRRMREGSPEIFDMRTD